MRTLQLIFASLIFVFCMTPAGSHAASIKVLKKLKKNRAVVKFKGAKARKGKVFSLSDGEEDEEGGMMAAGGIRKNFLSLGGGLTLGGGSTAITPSITYGIVMGSIEFGLTGGFAMASAGGFSTTILTVGGEVDFNFSPNTSGTNLIPALGATANMLLLDGSGMTFGGIFKAKMFPFGHQWFSFQPGAFFRMTIVSGASSSQFGAEMALRTYF